jgi:hypothetical protein
MCSQSPALEVLDSTGEYLEVGFSGRVATRVPGVAQAVVAQSQQDEAHYFVHGMPLLLHNPARLAPCITGKSLTSP